MPKVTIYADERYPDYGVDLVVDHARGEAVEVDEEFLKRYDAAEAAYTDMQNELGALHQQARRNKRGTTNIS